MKAVPPIRCGFLVPLVLCGVLAVPPGIVAGDKPLPPAQGTAVDFSKQIAPLLRARCLSCHGPDKARSGLRLDTRAHALRGGNSGAVIQVGKSAASRFIHVVAGADRHAVVMPPKGPRLTAEEVGLLRTWIDQGAPWADRVVLQGATEAAGASGKAKPWAFRPIRRPPPPAVRGTAWVRNPIDLFIRSRLEAAGIEPSPPADRATLLRRVSLDLSGLPPRVEEVDAFLADPSPDAYEKAVDRLLASPHYGEKWARPWLDLCHYADTDGYLTDQLRPVAWRYRQWLVEALNRDLPFDQFTLQQLAGDLLPGAGTEQLLATGFLRNTLSNREGGADLEEFRVEQVVDRVMMVGAAWLGLTVGCARCHDHKYDPITQQEFYQLYAYFDSADEVNIDAPLPGEPEPYRAKRPAYDSKRHALLQPQAKAIAALEARWEQKLREAAAQPDKDATWARQWEILGLVWGGNLGEGQLEGTQIVLLDPAQRTQDEKDRLLDYFLQWGEIIDPKRFQELKLAALHKQLEQLKGELPRLTRAPVMRQARQPRQTYVHVRGDFRSKGVPVRPGTPAVLPPPPPGAAANRLGLAAWLLAPDNPLPARVAVNRAWQEFFGRGLVLTSENFGAQGEKPSHPELLDWLAAELRAGGWSMKRLHRLIVTSATYRQSSRTRPELLARDPTNRLLARQASLRLSSDQVRDAALAVSGLLNRKLGGPCVFPPQPASVAMEGFENKWLVSPGRDRYRRALYTFVQRLSPFAQSVTFDAPFPNRICTRRERSNTPLQALTLLNDPVFFEAAQALAARLLAGPKKAAGDRVEEAFRICLSRLPTPRERDRLLAYYRQQAALLGKDPRAAKRLPPKGAGMDPAESGAWTGVCSVLLNLHEFLTRD